MEFPLNDLLAGLIFSMLLAWWVRPASMALLPMLAVMAYPLWAQDAAFTAYIVTMFFGLLIGLLQMGIVDER